MTGILKIQNLWWIETSSRQRTHMVTDDVRFLPVITANIEQTRENKQLYQKEKKKKTINF